MFHLRLRTDNGRRNRVRGDLQTPILNEAKLSEKCRRRILFLVPTLAPLLFYLILRVWYSLLILFTGVCFNNNAFNCGINFYK